MKHTILKSSLLTLTLSFSVYAYCVIRDGQGLDNNHVQNIDRTLETLSSEELLFDDVAKLIAGFVDTQFEIRKALKDNTATSFLRGLFIKDETKKNILGD